MTVASVVFLCQIIIEPRELVNLITLTWCDLFFVTFFTYFKTLAFTGHN